jgi:hypothetical protein
MTPSRRVPDWLIGYRMGSRRALHADTANPCRVADITRAKPGRGHGVALPPLCSVGRRAAGCAPFGRIPRDRATPCCVDLVVMPVSAQRKPGVVSGEGVSSLGRCVRRAPWACRNPDPDPRSAVPVFAFIPSEETDGFQGTHGRDGVRPRGAMFHVKPSPRTTSNPGIPVLQAVNVGGSD